MVKSRGIRYTAFGLLVLLGCAVFLALFLLPEREPPAPLHSYEASVEKGQYLDKAGNCMTCHTTEEGEPYAGGREFQTPFGTLYSTNITMDEETGIGAWSFEDFYNSMKYGVRPDGTHLYPAFPYTDFAKMKDEDIASLYLYMQTIEPVEAPARENALEFPFNQRQLLAGWKALYHDSQTFTPDPAKSAKWNRGAYLVEGPGHCGGCHSPRNLFGAEKKAMAFTGGVFRDQVKFGYHRQWTGVNLTPHPAGLESWEAEDIVAYLRDGMTDHSIVHGPMKEVVMNSTRYLTDEDLEAIAVYLQDLTPAARKSGSRPTEETLAEGEIVYTVHCGSCHLPSGQGAEGLGVPLTGSATVQAADPSTMINVILYGPHLPANLVIDRSQMKMFGKRLSDEDIASAATYVRTRFGNDAGAVTPEQVNAQR